MFKKTTVLTKYLLMVTK